MANLGQIKFWNARVGNGKVIEVKQLGSGTYDHVGFFSSTGHTSAVQINEFQRSTLLVDDAGTPFLATFGGSGYFTNNRLKTSTGVVISGLPRGPYDVLLTKVNKFLSANLAIEPDFRHRPSGTLLITYQASGASLVNIFNPKLFAFDALGAVTDPPPGVNVFGYEINASGQWFSSAVSGVWQQTTGQGSPILLGNRSTAKGWKPRNEHYFGVGLSVRPTDVGVISDWNLAFSMQFA